MRPRWHGCVGEGEAGRKWGVTEDRSPERQSLRGIVNAASKAGLFCLWFSGQKKRSCVIEI